MNILVTGSNGQLGRHFQLLAPQSKHCWHFTDVADLDITSREAVIGYVQSHHISLIVNCAAYTNVDKAETDDQVLAATINGTAVGNLAEAMNQVGGTLIHFSTDYVFGGNRNNAPCTEEEPANPIGVYGQTKLQGEQEAAKCRSLIIRTSWLYSEYGKNFLLTMLRLTAERPEVRVVFDQVGTPTYAGDLARAVLGIIEEGKLDLTGTYHFANEGACSWYDFAYTIADLSGHTSCQVLPCHSNEYPSPVHRPAYSVLDKTKFKHTFGQAIPHWTDGLRRCMHNLSIL
ncbi:MAG: dTDP-4-dehydrorhamnose reductase [Bacteroidales bacterium]|nr:dTDP-4-dehydrorhamnose reductase [Bacteroidales bacterium]